MIVAWFDGSSLAILTKFGFWNLTRTEVLLPDLWEMKMGIDIQEYLTKLGQEKFRSIIIHAKPQSDASLRHYACQVHDKIGGGYLDVLGYFISNSQLAAEVDRFTPDQFKTLLQDKSKGQKLFIMDRTS